MYFCDMDYRLGLSVYLGDATQNRGFVFLKAI